MSLELTRAQDDLYFTRYMAENLSALEYKTLEEVLTIIKYLTSVLSTSGTHIVESLCPSQLLAQLHGDIRPDVNASDVSRIWAGISIDLIVCTGESSGSVDNGVR